jgi:GT2 family glycosyltransferase
VLDTKRLSLAIIIASTGRPGEIRQWKDRLAEQSRMPDLFCLSVSGPDDLPILDDWPTACEVVRSPKGLPVQRNAALDHVIGRVDIVAFFDDDYVGSRTLVEDVVKLFEDNAPLVGVSGHLLLDGIGGAGLSYEAAVAAVDAYDRNGRQAVWLRTHFGGLYGCNMAYRASAIGDVRFDEQLPLYGWLEDIDFGSRLTDRGLMAYTNAFAGVHQGIKHGRTSGVRLGYSQVANPIYLCRKGTLQRSTMIRFIVRHIAKNLARAWFPEPWIDRAGRLRGNLIALRDLIGGTLHPTRILNL